MEEIANAVLYEGYMLYPYRPSSVKNRQRWNFGVVYPKAYSELQNGADNWFMQTECLALATSGAEIGVKVRFLQAVARTIGELQIPVAELPAGSENRGEPDYRIVESLRLGDEVYQTWQEAVEREIVLPSIRLTDELSSQHSGVQFFPGGREVEPVRSADGLIAGLIARTKEAITVNLEVAIERPEESVFRIKVRILNSTPITNSDAPGRDEALMHSLLSAHTILTIDGGEFVSLLDPPASLKASAAECKNIGTWPVLAGDEGQRDGMLSSPIILYDYPQIAPESPGNLFDGTEIDEILALRILTLTDEEKHEMRHADERARQILERTEAMPEEHFMKLHGVLRGLRPAEEETK
jgi:hypothetical protein